MKQYKVLKELRFEDTSGKIKCFNAGEKLSDKDFVNDKHLVNGFIVSKFMVEDNKKKEVKKDA